MPSTSPATRREIHIVAAKAVHIFAIHNLRSCLFGSAACALYGNTRIPNDVDLLVLTNECQTARERERLKEMLTQMDSSFYLVPSKARNADYKVLWYRLSSSGGQRRRKCKVDILVPGIMDLPNVPVQRIRNIDGIPVMPFMPLLLMKLRG